MPELDFIKEHPKHGDISLKQGATLTWNMTWKDSTGAVIDLTGYAARMKIRKSIESSTVLASWTSASEFTIDGANSPNLILSVTAVATAALDWSGIAYYDIEIDDQGATPVVTRILQGKIELDKEVTR